VTTAKPICEPTLEEALADIQMLARFALRSGEQAIVARDLEEVILTIVEWCFRLRLNANSDRQSGNPSRAQALVRGRGQRGGRPELSARLSRLEFSRVGRFFAMHCAIVRNEVAAGSTRHPVKIGYTLSQLRQLCCPFAL
jgi:hypothetical protein